MKQKRDYVAQGEITSAPEPAKKKTRWLSIVFESLAVVAILLVMAVSANVIYMSAAFNMPFFVNGMSMYPTLNADGYNADGSPLNWSSGSNAPGDVVDYGYAKSGDKGNWRADLHRYDIVVVYYPDDYVRDDKGHYVLDDNGNKQLLPDKSAKIKRVIGLPGETIKLSYIDVDNRVWGKTTLFPGTEKEEVLTPLYTEADYPPIGQRQYNYQHLRDLGEYTWNLASNEYVVLGDNRAWSTDCFNGSRSFAVEADMIVGKAYLLIGKRKLGANSLPVNDWTYIFTPWNYRRLA